MKGWLIYSKKGCIYCEAAKDLLKKQKISYTKVDVDEQNKTNVYNIIDKKTNSYRFFPMIFKDGQFIGGYNELNEFLEEDNLLKMLTKLIISNKRKKGSKSRSLNRTFKKKSKV